MDIEAIREYCISKKGVSESFPFDETTLVFKIGGKMFALLGLDNNYINLKCNKEIAVERRDKYKEITPGYHMNKTHWNSVVYNEGLKTSFLKQLIDESYKLVFSNLTKKIRETIK